MAQLFYVEIFIMIYMLLTKIEPEARILLQFWIVKSYWILPHEGRLDPYYLKHILKSPSAL